MSLRSLTGPEVRRFRYLVGMSQRELADALGIKKRTVIAWEGEQNPTPPFLAYAFAAINAGLPPWTPPPEPLPHDILREFAATYEAQQSQGAASEPLRRRASAKSESTE